MSYQSDSESEFEEPDESLGGKRKRKVSNREESITKKSREASKNCSATAPTSEDDIIFSYNHGVAGFGRNTPPASTARSQRLPTSIGDAIRLEWGLPSSQQACNPPMSSGDFIRDRQYQSDAIRAEWGLACCPQVHNPPTSSGDCLALSDFLKNNYSLLTSRELVDSSIDVQSIDDSAPNGSGRQSKAKKEDISPHAIGNVGYNLLNATPLNAAPKRSGLRPIIIDGCNVAFGCIRSDAMPNGTCCYCCDKVVCVNKIHNFTREHVLGRHGRGKFSSRGLEICVSFFLRRNHWVVAFLPLFRRSQNQTKDPITLAKLERDGHLVYTPSRWLNDKLVAPYDDRYIVQVAAELGGVIVSNDNYRDIMPENPIWEKTIKEKLLMHTWVRDILIFPLDPLGRYGPTLQKFLEF